MHASGQVERLRRAPATLAPVHKAGQRCAVFAPRARFPRAVGQHTLGALKVPDLPVYCKILAVLAGSGSLLAVVAAVLLARRRA